MRRQLIQLPPDTRFRLKEFALTGTLLAVSESRACVRLDRPPELVEFAGPDGQERRFRASRYTETSWASTVVVEAFSVGASGMTRSFRLTLESGWELHMRFTPRATRWNGTAAMIFALTDNPPADRVTVFPVAQVDRPETSGTSSCHWALKASQGRAK